MVDDARAHSAAAVSPSLEVIASRTDWKFTGSQHDASSEDLILIVIGCVGDNNSTCCCTVGVQQHPRDEARCGDLQHGRPCC